MPSFSFSALWSSCLVLWSTYPVTFMVFAAGLTLIAGKCLSLALKPTVKARVVVPFPKERVRLNAIVTIEHRKQLDAVMVVSPAKSEFVHRTMNSRKGRAS